MRHRALDKGPLPTHTCPLENLTTFPGNRRTKVLLILGLASPHIHTLEKTNQIIGDNECHTKSRKNQKP